MSNTKEHPYLPPSKKRSFYQWYLEIQKGIPSLYSFLFSMFVFQAIPNGVQDLLLTLLRNYSWWKFKELGVKITSTVCLSWLYSSSSPVLFFLKKICLLVQFQGSNSLETAFMEEDNWEAVGKQSTLCWDFSLKTVIVCMSTSVSVGRLKNYIVQMSSFFLIIISAQLYKLLKTCSKNPYWKYLTFEFPSYSWKLSLSESKKCVLFQGRAGEIRCLGRCLWEHCNEEYTLDGVVDILEVLSIFNNLDSIKIRLKMPFYLPESYLIFSLIKKL